MRKGAIASRGVRPLVAVTHRLISVAALRALRVNRWASPGPRKIASTSSGTKASAGGLFGIVLADVNPAGAANCCAREAGERLEHRAVWHTISSKLDLAFSLQSIDNRVEPRDLPDD